MWYDDRYFQTPHFDTSLIDFDLDSRSQECKKAKTSVPIIWIDLDGIWYTIELCCCDEPQTHFISSVQYSRERTLVMWFREKK